MVKLMTAMARFQLIDEWSSREMISIMTGQHHNGLIPQPLPRARRSHTRRRTPRYAQRRGRGVLEPRAYAIAVMATNLSTLDAGYHFIQGVSRIAYSELARFGLWRQTNDYAATPFDAAPPASAAASTSPERDLQMWTPPTSRLAPSR